MIEKPSKAVKQSSPVVENKESNLGNPASVTNSSVFVLNQTIGLQPEQDSENVSDEIPVDIEISPADIASIDMSRFLQYMPTYTAEDIPKIKLPDGFTFSFSPVSGGKYGSITTSPSGQQSVTVNVEIPDVNGIINYEVRLVKND